MDADPAQTTAHALTRGQFNDHIPEVLDAFERKLRSRPGGVEAREADVEKRQEEIKHGLHRWQQGYRLQELMREWGHLQLCLFEELNVLARTHPEFERETLVEANRQLIMLVNEAISESAVQYQRMQQAEATGRLSTLTESLASLNEIERRRATLIHQAVHDLNNDVVGVSIAATLLGRSSLGDTERSELSSLLNQGVQGVTTMLSELKELARLEAGQETREVLPFDAAELIVELCELLRPMARARGLFLNFNGESALCIDGDPGKLRRLLQNLLVNALKYTHRGGVVVSCGEQKSNWWLMIADTGPGLPDGPDSPMVAGLKEATASARESDEKTAANKGEESQVLTPSLEVLETESPVIPEAGEGIGLSIVKRLCELLDASLEMTSSAESGTTFRVVLPRSYPESSGES